MAIYFKTTFVMIIASIGLLFSPVLTDSILSTTSMPGNHFFANGVCFGNKRYIQLSLRIKSEPIQYQAEILGA